MKTNYIYFALIFFVITSLIFSQSLKERYNHLGEMFVLELTSAPFPHPDRMNGHKYDDKIYSFEEHYNDSSVAVFIPNNFIPTDSLNFVVYFHGWNNNIDTACTKFNLIEQFSESNLNAVFVFPEGPKMAPDSFGGRMEEKDGLKKLIDDIQSILIEKEKIQRGGIGDIILAGHSGAFRVISFCLMRGGLTQNISDVILFDALYGQTEKYLHWIENYNGRFIDIYTDRGGTIRESENLIEDFDAWEIPYFMVDEINLKMEDLSKNRLVFIHSDLSHSEVISKRNQLRNFLLTSKLPKIIN